MFNPVLRTIEWLSQSVRSLALAIAKPRYFYKDSLDSKVTPFSTLLNETKATLKEMPNNTWEIRCTWRSMVRVTTAVLVDEFDLNKSSVVYHHGAGETSYKQKMLWLKWNFKGYNIFLIKAQHHDSFRDYVANCMDSFLHWELTFVGSVLAVEELIRWHKKYSKKSFLVSGGSMGGIVASLHYFYFGSGDYYLPIVAYPNVGELFLVSAYKNAVDKYTKRRLNDDYFQAFNIPEGIKLKRDKSKILPIIGTFDPIVTFKKASAFWKGYEVSTLEAGHLTMAFRFLDIKRITDTISLKLGVC